MFERIDQLAKEMKALPPLRPASLEQLLDDFCVSYTYNTNAIEGNPLTERETYMVLKDGMTISGKPLRSHMEVLGHRNAFQYIRRLADEHVAISGETILATHHHLLLDNEDARGRYRDVDVYISGADVELPSADSVPRLMERLLADYRTTLTQEHIVRRVALFHLRFESIHPFLDGNGRTGRLLMNHELMLHGYPPIDIKFQDKERYYLCLQQYQGSDENELPMAYMVSEYLEAALQTRIRAMQQAQELRKQQER